MKINNPKTKFRSPIHSLFMFKTIDVYFLDKNKEIFEKTTLKPWKVYIPSKKATYIIEFKKGKIKDKLKVGDKIDFVCMNS